MAPSPFKSVAIFGFGLIGGSLAAAIRKRDPSVELIAIDVTAVIDAPSAQALVDRLVDASDAAAVRAAVEQAELTVLAVPVGVIERELGTLLSHAQVLTDCGSTKQTICAAAADHPRAEVFVPGHPMAGSPRPGHQHADADLFCGRPWLLCPENGAPAHVKQVAALISFLGGVPAELGPAAHDKAVAVTSHLPQLLASLLVLQTERCNGQVAAGPGFESATRVAGGDERMWRDIFEANSAEVASAALELSQQLHALATEMKGGSVSGALAVLNQARQQRNKTRS